MADVGQPLGQGVAWHLVTEFVLEIRGFRLGALREGARIGDGACHDAADRRRDLEDVRDGRGVDEFILVPSMMSSGSAQTREEVTYRDLLLGQNYGAVLAPDTNRHDVRRCDRLESIFCNGAQPSAPSTSHRSSIQAGPSSPRLSHQRITPHVPTWNSLPCSEKMVMCRS